MTDQNNAAQAAQLIKIRPHDITQHLRTQEEMAEYLTACVQEGADDPAFLRKAVNDVVAAALKLRAPVADERAAFEHHARACELTRDEDAPDDYRNSHVQEYWNGWKARAALASAPVAGEAVYTLRVRGPIQAWTPTAAAFSIPDGEHQLFLSPAAPQASEAARILFPAHLRKMWSGGEVQAWLDERQGIKSPKVSAKGSMERNQHWQADQAQARKEGAPSAMWETQ